MLIAVLALIAVITLAFTGRYPRDFYALVMGLYRRVLRAAAHAALIRPVPAPRAGHGW